MDTAIAIWTSCWAVTIAVSILVRIKLGNDLIKIGFSPGVPDDGPELILLIILGISHLVRDQMIAVTVEKSITHTCMFHKHDEDK